MAGYSGHAVAAIIIENEKMNIIENNVIATIDSEPDEELVDLVRSVMSSRTKPITMPELVDGILNLHKWREYRTYCRSFLSPICLSLPVK